VKGFESRPARRRGEMHLSDEHVAVEEPLEIRVDGETITVTMRTPGHDVELATGFLFAERVIEQRDDLRAVAHIDTDPDGYHNVIEARLAMGLIDAVKRAHEASRSLYATSSCGICGTASLERLRVVCAPIVHTKSVPDEVLFSLPDTLRAHQPVFAATGGLHGAALFRTNGELVVCREDIGRHNAVDKVIGWAVSNEEELLERCVLMVSSRAGFEIVHKARIARIPTIAALGAASSLAVDLANDGNQTLIGWLRDGQCTRYT